MAEPVLDRPNCAAVAKSNVHCCNIPSSTIWRKATGRPSPSNGREPPVRVLSGFSINDIPFGKTELSIASCNHVAPRVTAEPLVADSKCPMRPLEIRSSYRTGKTPVGGLRAPWRSTARIPADCPTSAAPRKSERKIRESPS